jgi:hypothetical protein
MAWIKLEDGTYAEQATPDPRRILTSEELQEELQRKQEEIAMYENEITHINQRKQDLEAEILEINNLLQ